MVISRSRDYWMPVAWIEPVIIYIVVDIISSKENKIVYHQKTSGTLGF
jgi:hypothetical protein